MFQKKIPVPVLFILAAAVIGAGGFWYWSSLPQTAPVRAPTVAPPLALPSGKQTYKISGAFNSPEIYEATIDPVDVHVGDTQIMTVKIKDTEFPIATVVAEVETDTGIKEYDFSLIAGTNADGTWEASWVVHDTHDEVYHTTYRAVNTEGEESSVTLTWTDPCAPPPSGDWTLLGVCNTGAGVITGADGDGSDGDIHLNGNAVTIDAGSTFVWNPGRTIFIEGGSIALNTTAVIKKSPIYITDSDSDGYPTSVTQYLDPGEPGDGRRRRYKMNSLSTFDSCDSNASRISEASYYDDDDSDGYRGSFYGSYCSNPGGKVTSSASSDCNDSNSSKWRNLTGYLDSDGDGVNDVSAFPNNSQSVCSGNSLPSGYTSSLSSRGDCAGSNSSKWQEILGYPDADGDGVYSFSNDSICSGSSIAAADGSTSSGTDCDDGNSSIWAYVDGYWDKDGDGHNGEWDGLVCTDGNLPQGWTDTGDDCDENDVNVYQEKIGYFSRDGDGSVSDTLEQLCTNATVYDTAGFDCDDSDGTIFPRNAYKDGDGDGQYEDTLTQWVCAGTTAPSGWSYSVGTDCDDSDSNTYEKTGWFDEDSDGQPSTSSKTMCTSAGFATIAGADCNDSDANVFSTNRYWDVDGDGYYYTSKSSRCADISNSSLSAGSDCYDGHSLAYPGASSWWRKDRGDGSYDWNCDGVEQKQITTVSGYPSKGCYSSRPTYSGGRWWADSVPACGVTADQLTCTGWSGPSCFTDQGPPLGRAPQGGNPCPSSGNVSWSISGTSITQTCR